MVEIFTTCGLMTHCIKNDIQFYSPLPPTQIEDLDVQNIQDLDVQNIHSIFIYDYSE